MSEPILLDADSPVAVVTIARPEKRNAFTREMRLAMEAHLADRFADPACRAVILTGAGGHFSSGADLGKVDADAAPWTPVQTRENFREVHRLIRLIVTGPKPVIAAVEGLAYGGGFSLAVACDHVVAACDARFGGAFSKLGLLGDMGLLWTLKERVGIAAAKRILLLGQPVSGTEAHEVGIADELCEPGQALAAAKAAAAPYLEVAPLSIAYTKAAYADGIDTIEDAFRAEANFVPILNQSEDFRAAVAAFKDKRPPRFTAR